MFIDAVVSDQLANCGHHLVGFFFTAVFFSSFQRACPPELLGRAMTQLLSLIALVRAPSYALAGVAYTALGTAAPIAACAVLELAGAAVYVLTASRTAPTLASSAGRS